MNHAKVGWVSGLRTGGTLTIGPESRKTVVDGILYCVLDMGFGAYLGGFVPSLMKHLTLKRPKR